MYNQEEDRFYCLLEAPNKQAIKDHHNKYGFKWITEVKTTA
jgi:Nickel responsive protein SCO4226-like